MRQHMEVLDQRLAQTNRWLNTIGDEEDGSSEVDEESEATEGEPTRAARHPGSVVCGRKPSTAGRLMAGAI